MPNVSASDIVDTARRFLAEPSTAGRFSDLDILANTDMAQKQVMLRVEWPEATYSVTSDGVSREYVLPEIDALLRVYVAGIQCVPSTLAILSGSALDLNRVPPTFQGQWAIAPFTGYPQALNFSGGGAAGTLPYFTGQAPSFYTRSGNLGIVPPPTAGSTIAVDVYPAPIPIVSMESLTFFPNNFEEALAWRTLMYCFFSLGDAGAQQVQACSAMYREQIIEVLLPWKQSFNRNLPNAPMIATHRIAGPPRRTGFR